MHTFTTAAHRFALTAIMLIECMAFCPTTHAADEAAMQYADESHAQYLLDLHAEGIHLGADQGDEDRFADYNFEPDFDEEAYEAHEQDRQQTQLEAMWHKQDEAINLLGEGIRTSRWSTSELAGCGDDTDDDQSW